MAPSLSRQELREFNGILKVKLPTREEREEGGITVRDRLNSIKIIEKKFRDRVNEVAGDPEKEELYESIVDVAKLKADQLRLEANLRPESETAQNILARRRRIIR